MRRRNRKYQFTQKKKSVRGIVSCCGAGVSLLLLLIVISDAIALRGNGSLLIGIIGMAGLVIGVVSFFEGTNGVKEENTFVNIPYIGVVLSGIAMVLWILLYLVGMLL